VNLPAGGYDTLSPRTRLLTVPFAFRAADVSLPISKSIAAEFPLLFISNTG